MKNEDLGSVKSTEIMFTMAESSVGRRNSEKSEAMKTLLYHLSCNSKEVVSIENEYNWNVEVRSAR